MKKTKWKWKWKWMGHYAALVYEGGPDEE